MSRCKEMPAERRQLPGRPQNCRRAATFLHSAEMTTPAAAARSWGFSPWVPALGAAVTAGGLVWALLATPGRDHLVAITATVLGLIALIVGRRWRPRLLADAGGITVRMLLGARHVPWSEIESVTTVSHRRLGTSSSMLEINLRDDLLLAFSDIELGARGEEVAAVLRTLHAAASPG